MPAYAKTLNRYMLRDISHVYAETLNGYAQRSIGYKVWMQVYA